MRNVRTILLSILCLFVTASAIDTRKAHALSSSTIVATTDQTSYYVGDTIKVIIKGENILDLNGVGFTLNYDASLLNLQGSGIVLSPSYESFGGAIIDTDNGSLTYDILNKAPVSYTKTEPIGQINFKVLKSGIGMIQLRGITAVNGNLEQIQSSAQMQTAFSIGVRIPGVEPTDPSPSSPTSSTPPTTPKPSTTQIILDNDLPAAVKGKVTIQMEEGKNTILLPSRLTDLIGENNLQIMQKDFTIVIPKEALKHMQGALIGKQVDGAQLSFSAIIASQDDITKRVQGAINGSTRIVTASQVYDFSLHVVTTDGTRIPITTFEEPLVLSFQVNPNADSHLLGMYYIAYDGTIQYMGGTLVHGSMTAKLTHFSPYAVLAYDKTFSDVASSLWSSRVIKEMAAKHIIEGITDTEFNPGGHVTRAQFAALLARALGLKAVGSTHFKDVNPGDWHEQVIAAVSEAGIVLGRSSDTFAPDDVITREEMAVMVVRAYEHVKGEQVTLSNTDSFSDQAQVHEWAQNAVRGAQQVGLIQGRSNNQFAPQALMTRAESAQVIANLLND